MINEVYRKLLQCGYSQVESNREEVRVFYRYEDSLLISMLTVHTSGDYYPNTDQLNGIAHSVKQMFRGKGYGNVQVLSLIVTEDASRAKAELYGKENFWILDTKYERVLIYENQPAEYHGLYQQLDDLLDAIRRARTSRMKTSASQGRAPKRKSLINLVLIGLNVLVFLAMEVFGERTIVEMGALDAGRIFGNGEFYRLFTCMFIHFGIDHIFNNMLVLFAIGDYLERLMGRWRYLILYLLGGLGAGLASAVYSWTSGSYYISAGASGAVFAVVGAMFFIVLINKGRVQDISGRGLVLMICLSLYHGFTSSGIDNIAHVGGLISGFILAIPLYRKKRG